MCASDAVAHASAGDPLLPGLLPARGHGLAEQAVDPAQQRLREPPAQGEAQPGELGPGLGVGVAPAPRELAARLDVVLAGVVGVLVGGHEEGAGARADRDDGPLVGELLVGLDQHGVHPAGRRVLLAADEADDHLGPAAARRS